MLCSFERRVLSVHGMEPCAELVYGFGTQQRRYGTSPADDVGLKTIEMLINLLAQRIRDPDEFGQNTIVSNFFVFQFYLKSLKPEINYG